MMASSSQIAAWILEGVELGVMWRMRSVCWISSVERSDEEMVGCGGSKASIIEALFEAATEEGSVSGSKRAFSILASLAERLVLVV